VGAVDVRAMERHQSDGMMTQRVKGSGVEHERFLQSGFGFEVAVILEGE
jgi:hypothetical protein